jgi:hypothetical protein
MLSGGVFKTSFAFFFFLALSAQAESEMNGFSLKDALVSPRKIHAGGPPRDGIPALSSPEFVSVQNALFLKESDRVLGVSYQGTTKAYPIKILNYHEIVNDRFDETPIAVTFCPLCGTGIAFFSEAGGRPRTFGVSGLLYNSDVLMYDRETESLWSQIMAQAISGPARGTRLRAVPIRHTTWEDWRRRHPDTVVLEPPTRYRRNYNVDPYLGYADSKRIWFPVTHSDKRYKPKAIVIGIILGDSIKAYPFDELPRDADTIQDTLGNQPIVVKYDHQSESGEILDADGTEIPTFTAYWFAWAAFHPNTDVYSRR